MSIIQGLKSPFTIIGVTVFLLVNMVSCGYSNMVVNERPIGDPYEQSGVRSCETVGFCSYMDTSYNYSTGDIEFRQVYGYYYACEGREPVKYTHQNFEYERRNGKIYVRPKVLNVTKIGECKL